MCICIITENINMEVRLKKKTCLDDNNNEHNSKVAIVKVT